MSSVLICGITGQDGAFLAQHLLEKGFEVHGTSRDALASNLWRLKALGIESNIFLHSMALNDFRSVLHVLSSLKPSQIYNLAGQTSVGLSFEQPVETFESIVMGTLNLLEAIRFLNYPTKLFNAGSSECFGNTLEPATEQTSFNPRSPYGVAKASAYHLVANYREAYSLFACSGILFNHESHLRSKRFVTQKIIDSVVRIANGSQEKLSLGNIEIVRDWGWAPEYVRLMHKILEQDVPEDYVICTGQSYSLKEFLECAFSYFKLNWKDHTTIIAELLRPSDISMSVGNPDKAGKFLEWQPLINMPSIVDLMIKERVMQ